jgi:CubicO group peptidase (beta-lactamase class C family)
MISEAIIKDVLSQTTGKSNIKYTVGIYKNGETEIKVFDEFGETEFKKYYYEIGSITKTFTGMLVTKAVEEGKIELEAPISRYIFGLDESKYYPTIKRLITHTSGYRSDPEEYDHNEYYQLNNPFFDVSREQLLNEIKETLLEDKAYPYRYSNLGASIAGLVLESVYQRSYDSLMRELLEALDMKDTYTFDVPYNLNGYGKNGDDCNHWYWNNNCAYCPAGYISTNIYDLLHYVKIHITSEDSFITEGHKSYAIKSDDGLYQTIGAFWNIIPEWNVIYHTGGSGCFIGILIIDTLNKNAVVVLSNRYVEGIEACFGWIKSI